MLRLFQAARPFKAANVLRDAFAGFTLAAMNIPQVLGYTKIAGMPVVTGLYSLLLPLVAKGMLVPPNGTAPTKGKPKLLLLLLPFVQAPPAFTPT